jgi:hypothetical protein
MSWDPQVKFFARRYHVLTYAARGYPLRVPEEPTAYPRTPQPRISAVVIEHLGLVPAHRHWRTSL